MITRVQIKNFQGIRLVEYDLGALGAVLAGRNGGGKTSTIEAVRAALTGEGIDASAITLGEEACEILVDLDNATVRQRINAAGKGSVVVTDANGARVSSPREWLQALLGVSPLDPLDLIDGVKTEADRKARVAKVLAAIPVSVGEEQLARWAPDVDLATALGRDAAGKPNTSGHGLQVVEKVRDAAYASRTIANRAAKERKAEVDKALAEAQAARAEAFGDEDTPAELEAGDPVATAAAALEEAEKRSAEARAAVVTGRAQAEAARTAGEREAKTRAKVGALREQAAAKRSAASAAPSDEERLSLVTAREEAVAVREQTADKIRAARTALEKAEEEELDAANAANTATAALAALDEQVDAAVALVGEASALDSQAADLEGALVPAGAPVDLAALDEQVAAAVRAVARARAAQAFVARRQLVDAAQARELEAQDRAKRLDEQVRTLSKDAPAALMAGAGPIQGLAIEGTDILLDGKSIDRLSGAEQLRLAVQLARRLNAKSKILVVDGLERLDPEQLPTFLEMATADGYQLLGTRVSSGPVHLEPIGGES